MKRILSLLLPVAAVAIIMGSASAFAQMPTPTPRPKGGGGGAPGGIKPQVVKPVAPQVVRTAPVVTHTPPPKPVIRTNTITRPTPPPTAVTNKQTFHKGPAGGATPAPVINKNVTINKNTAIKNTTVTPPGGGNPKFKKGAGGNPGTGPAVVNNTTFVHNTPTVVNNKTWSGPKIKGGGGGGGGGGGQFNRSNNYGGHWVEASAVPNGWDRTGEHQWHGHHYRWFNGGWLIVDGGFWPTGYYSWNSGGSKMYNAQAELANMGYYNGDVDGVAGPETRQAIANYQADNDLPVDGHLNPPTQVSLGLEAPQPND